VVFRGKKGVGGEDLSWERRADEGKSLSGYTKRGLKGFGKTALPSFPKKGFSKKIFAGAS
jgi:hypothetical protein